LRQEHPLITTIIPVYNGERYLAEAIGSVLRQTYQPVEIIIVDDGSTDGSAVVARALGARVRYCYQANRGIGAARNAGTDMATGNYLAFLDADDMWTPEKLKRQVEAVERDPSLDMVFGHVQQFVSPDLPGHLRQRLRCPSYSLPGRLPGAMLVARDAFSRVGYFNSAVGEVVDWILRAQELGLRSTVLPEVVLRRRLHSTNTALRHADIRREYARYLKASLDRRRAGGTA
jgi:glycosyltransferase involved in cell wall biosynthesis